VTIHESSRAGRREWIGLAVLALPTLLMSLDVSVLYLALPILSKDLGASSVQQLWIMDIYEFMLAGFLVTMGTLGDRIGRRKLLLIGAAAFSVASVIAANSSSAGTLIAARAALGVAGATLMPSTLALISNMFKAPRQRGIAIAIWMNCFMVGMVIGPLVGGMLLETFGWGSVFLLGVPVMVLLLVTAPFLLPEYRDLHAGKLDLLSVGLYLVGVLPIIYGVKSLAKDGVAAAPIAAIVFGTAVSVWFVRRQATITSPLLDLRLFSNRAFSATLGIMLVIAVVMGGMGLLVPQYLQLVAGMSPLRAGVWMVPQMLGMVVGSTLAAAIGPRIRPGYVIAVGLAVAAVGLALMTRVDSADGVVLLTIGFVAATVGISPSVVLGTDLVVGSAPREKAGSAASTSETSNHLGIALGVALLGSVAAAVYRSRVALPASLPVSTIDAARESIAGAVTVVEQLPATVRAEVLVQARDAFTMGMNAAAGIGAVVFLALAVVAATVLRHVRSGTAVGDEGAVGVSAAGWETLAP
jgi:DHA2 family multidrug resistance protein-like MFS transporter